MDPSPSPLPIISDSIACAIQANLKEIGINATIERWTWPLTCSATAKAITQRAIGGYTSAFCRVYVVVFTTPLHYASNKTRLKTAKVDALID